MGLLRVDGGEMVEDGPPSPGGGGGDDMEDPVTGVPRSVPLPQIWALGFQWAILVH
jgi:hypothetical protein